MEEVLVRAKARDKATPLHPPITTRGGLPLAFALQGHLAHGFTRSAQLVISFPNQPQKGNGQGYR